MRRLLLLAGLLWAAPGRAQPTEIPALAPALPSLAPALTEYTARALARLIETTREQAIAKGVKPIPPAVYRSLLGYFPAALLQRVRFASGRAAGIALPALAFTYGDTLAMTLGDVILFRDERAAESDMKLWAHELTHVLQYQRWGTDGFAHRYVTDRPGVEREAIDHADRFMAWKAKPTPPSRVP